ncbi:RecQ family ATP-dependent DNA helicase, partial [Salmonella enterica subsp. enterica]|nr:RecQ family ATP-dependent DNA helicase [Salmonella enterica subsp. enterica]
DNITQIFQGKVKFSSLDEAQQKIAPLNLNSTAKALWNAVLQALLNANDDDGLSADSIADDAVQYLSQASGSMQHIEAKDVMRVLTQMADMDLISKGLLLTARMRAKGKDNARQTTELIHKIEIEMLNLMMEDQPDFTPGESYPLQISLLNQRIIEKGYLRSNTTLIQNLLFSWSQDARKNGQKGLIGFRYGTRNSYQITLHYSWSDIGKYIRLRHQVTSSVLNFLYALVAGNDESNVKKVMLSFSLEQV